MEASLKADLFPISSKPILPGEDLLLLIQRRKFQGVFGIFSRFQLLHVEQSSSKTAFIPILLKKFFYEVRVGFRMRIREVGFRRDFRHILRSTSSGTSGHLGQLPPDDATLLGANHPHSSHTLLVAIFRKRLFLFLGCKIGFELEKKVKNVRKKVKNIEKSKKMFEKK